MNTNRRLAIQAAVVFLASGLLVYLFLLLTGPDMRVQPSLNTYDARMPVLPEDAVPAVPGLFFPSERQTETAPTEKTAPTMARGKFAYDAYCVFCHGETGDGQAQVGQSYVPSPGDLRTARLKAMDDAALLRAMLTGVGHDPVLPRVVPPDDRPSLLLYVRAVIEGRAPVKEPGQPGQANALP